MILIEFSCFTSKYIRNMFIKTWDFKPFLFSYKFSIFCLAILVFFASGMFVSCTKFADPENELITGYTFSPVGSGQRGFSEEFLQDSVGIMVKKSNAYGFVPNLTVKFNILSGGGIISQATSVTNELGQAYIRWKLGSQTNNQKLSASIYNSEGLLLGITPILAQGFRKNSWDTITNGYENGIIDMIADTVHHLTYMLSNNTLFRQKTRYFDWKNDSTILTGISAVNTDPTLNFYAADWQGDIYKSFNQGLSWNKLAKPIPLYTGYLNMQVTPDNAIWVSGFQNSLVCSRDGGNTWHSDTIGIEKGEQLRGLIQLKSGRLFLTTLNGNLYRSDSSGKTWIKNTGISGVMSLYLHTNGALILTKNSINYGVEVFRSVDNGDQFDQVLKAWSLFSWSQRYNDVVPYNHEFLFLIPGKGIFRTKNFTQFDVFYDNPGIINLFIDHNGVLLVRDNVNRVFYYNGN